VVVFIWAPDEEGQFQPGRCNRWWLHNSLKSLSASLRKLGSRLILRSARQARALSRR
jgi:deoxyribodipyrimidine photolyase